MPGIGNYTVTDRYDRVIPKPFVVPVPKPYIVHEHGDPNHGAEISDEAKARLLTDAAALWKTLDMLGITPMEAYKADFSLNETTYDDLELRALRANRYDVTAFLREHARWSFKCDNHHSKKRERWVFTTAELEQPGKCRGTDEFLVTCPYDSQLEKELVAAGGVAEGPDISTWCERGIIVLRNGTVTDRYGDGTVGVSDGEKELIRNGDPAYYRLGGLGEFGDGSQRPAAEEWRNVIAESTGKLYKVL
jgi:hypothetical protein